MTNPIDTALFLSFLLILFTCAVVAAGMGAL